MGNSVVYLNSTDRVIPPLLEVSIVLVVRVVDLVEEKVVGALGVERAGLLHVEPPAAVEDDGSESQLVNRSQHQVEITYRVVGDTTLY